MRFCSCLRPDPFGDKYVPGQASMHPVRMFLDDFEPCIGQHGIKRPIRHNYHASAGLDNPEELSQALL